MKKTGIRQPETRAAETEKAKAADSGGSKRRNTCSQRGAAVKRKAKVSVGSGKGEGSACISKVIREQALRRGLAKDNNRSFGKVNRKA